MQDTELDTILQILENPVRRKIVKRLSRGPSYPLQLSKELGLGQPLVAKHLATMEEAGLVSSSMEESLGGPRRRSYSLARSISITLDMAPNLFIQSGFSFSSIEDRELSKEATSIMDETSKISGRTADIPALSDLLTKVDRQLDDLEEQRAILLYIRNKAMRTASKAMEEVDDREKKRVIYSILDEHNRNVAHLSEVLDLREAVVRNILKELESFLE